jgi:hypothetical protein
MISQIYPIFNPWNGLSRLPLALGTRGPGSFTDCMFRLDADREEIRRISQDFTVSDFLRGGGYWQLFSKRTYKRSVSRIAAHPYILTQRLIMKPKAWKNHRFAMFRISKYSFVKGASYLSRN